MKGLKARWALLLALGVAPLAHADHTFTVTTVLDEVDTDLADPGCNTISGACSLRAAIQQANAIADGTTTINMPIASTYALTISGSNENDAVTGDLDIKSRIIINGAGSGVQAIDGQSSDRVFDVHANANLTLNDLTIRNGHNQVDVVNPDIITQQNIGEQDGGGGIKAVQASLTLNRVNVSNNTAGGAGGGIDIRGGNASINASMVNNNFVAGFGGGISSMNARVVINDSTISDNTHFAQDIIFGGGIFNSGGQNSLAINRSTIARNSAYRDGGGIYHQVGGLAITNSTISGNVAARWGGGLYNANTVNSYIVDLLNVTITNNDARGDIRVNTQVFAGFDPRGGGIYNRAQESNQGGARLGLFNSIVALNGNGGDCFNDLETSPLAPAYLDKNDTVVGDGSCQNQGEGAATTYTASAIALGPLTNNSGPTQTHALQPGSIAIDFATANCPNHDQRKYGPRLLTSCDSGAFEFGATDFGLPLVIPPLPYTPPPPVGSNRLPQAFDLLTVVQPGSAVSTRVNAIDLDGDTLAYINRPPSPAQGTVIWNLNGDFTYTANAGATGIDTFGFGACDGVACDQGVVTVVINEPSVESRVVATIAPNNGQVSPVTVISQSDLLATMSDPDFAYPLGAMFFDVNNVTPDVGTDTITVTLHFPATLTIDPDAVVRKMNKFGIWSTMSTVPSSTESSAVFDPVARTVTLILRDNDIFDLNSTVGIISDPVALGVSATGATPTGGGTATTGGSTPPISGGSGGGGIAGLGWLAGLLFFGLWRRRASLNIH